jgi:hypothetical protein
MAKSGVEDLQWPVTATDSIVASDAAGSEAAQLIQELEAGRKVALAKARIHSDESMRVKYAAIAQAFQVGQELVEQLWCSAHPNRSTPAPLQVAARHVN